MNKATLVDYQIYADIVNVYVEEWGSKRINSIYWNLQINFKGDAVTLEGSKSFVSRIVLNAPEIFWGYHEEIRNKDLVFKEQVLDRPPWEIHIPFGRKLKYDVKGNPD